jgi:F-type H+-transporting ATPase subunit alpha
MLLDWFFMNTNSIENNQFKNSINLNVGYVKSVADGIVKAAGLKNVAFGEVVTFLNTDNIRGITCNLNKNDVDILILGDDRYIKVGMMISGTSTGLRVPVTKKLLGRVINPIGEIIDGGEDIGDIKYNADINVKAPGIIFRQKVSEPVFTGIKIIDSLIPVGKGQRELIIGDKGTGKTSIAFDTILSQKNENLKSSEDSVFCIYVSIGQKKI